MFPKRFTGIPRTHEWGGNFDRPLHVDYTYLNRRIAHIHTEYLLSSSSALPIIKRAAVVMLRGKSFTPAAHSRTLGCLRTMLACSRAIVGEYISQMRCIDMPLRTSLIGSSALQVHCSTT